MSAEPSTAPDNVIVEGWGTPIPPAALSYLISRHAPRGPGPCRVCGHEMTVGSMGGGKATVYHCGSPEAVFLGAEPHLRDAALTHYRASEVSVAYHGDEDVAAALLELRALREAAGDDMSVPTGTYFYPLGHSSGNCWRRAIHVGNDTWNYANDFKFEHDPTHAN